MAELPTPDLCALQHTSLYLCALFHIPPWIPTHPYALAKGQTSQPMRPLAFNNIINIKSDFPPLPLTKGYMQSQ